MKLNNKLLPETKAKILKGHTETELNDMVNSYIDLYGYTDVDADYIFEEICADAYAGIDVFADYLTDFNGAEQFSNEVNETAAENRTTARNAVNNSDNKNTAIKGGGAKYSLNPTFENDLDYWLENSSKEKRLLDGGRFLIGTTSEKLMNYGVDNSKYTLEKAKLQR